MNLIEGMRAFVAVVETGSFTKAGEKLDSSKTLTSKKVQALENHLGTRLLNRTTRSLSLTESGQMFHDRCLQVLDDVDELEALMSNQAAEPRGRLNITAPSTFGEMYIAPLMPRFSERYSEVTIDLNLTDRHVDLVDEGFDVAIRIGDLPSSGLIARKLAPAPIHVCATPAYLAKHGTPQHPADLASHQCIVDSNFRNGTLWPFLDGDDRLSVTVKGVLTANSARAIRSFVLSDAGVALCPGYVIADELQNGNLEPVLEQFTAFDLNVYALYNSKRNLAPKVRVFVDFLVKELANVSEGW